LCSAFCSMLYQHKATHKRPRDGHAPMQLFPSPVLETPMAWQTDCMAVLRQSRAFISAGDGKEISAAAMTLNLLAILLKSGAALAPTCCLPRSRIPINRSPVFPLRALSSFLACHIRVWVGVFSSSILQSLGPRLSLVH